MSKKWVIKIVSCFIMVNKNKLFHHTHHEFIKGMCFKWFDYADGLVFSYLLFCMLLLKTFCIYFPDDWLGYELKLQLRNKLRGFFSKDRALSLTHSQSITHLSQLVIG